MTDILPAFSRNAAERASRTDRLLEHISTLEQNETDVVEASSLIEQRKAAMAPHVAASQEKAAKAGPTAMGVAGAVSRDIVATPIGAARDAAQAMINLPSDAAEMLGTSQETLAKMRVNLPNVETSNELARDILQFFIPFGAIAKGTKVLKAGSRMARAGKATAVGAGVSGVAFEGDDGNLFNLVDQWTGEGEQTMSGLITGEKPKKPWVAAAAEYLAADKDDPALLNRFKNALADAALGVVADGFIEATAKTLKGYKAYKAAQQTDPYAAQAMGPNDGPPRAPMGPNDGPMQDPAQPHVTPDVDGTAVTNPFDQGGHVSDFQRGADTTVDNGGQGGLFGEMEDVVEEARTARMNDSERAYEELMGPPSPRAMQGPQREIVIPTDPVQPPKAWVALDSSDATRGAAPMDAPGNFGTSAPSYVGARPPRIVISETPPPGAVDMDEAVTRTLNNVARPGDEVGVSAAKTAVDNLFPEQSAKVAGEMPGAAPAEQLAATLKEAKKAAKQAKQAKKEADRVAMKAAGEEPGPLESAVASFDDIAEGSTAYARTKDGEWIDGTVISNNGRNVVIENSATGERVSVPRDRVHSDMDGATFGSGPVFRFKDVLGIARDLDTLAHGLGGWGNLAAGAAGAVAGAQSDEDGAWLAGMLGGMAVYKGGQRASKHLAKRSGAAPTGPLADAGKLQQAASVEPKLRKLTTDPNLRNINPGSRGPIKRVESLNPQKVADLAKALKSGKLDDLPTVDPSDFNLDKINSAEDVKTAMDVFSKQFDETIDQTTRGVVSMAATEKMAYDLGMTPKQMQDLATKTDFLGEKITNARAYMVASAKYTIDLAEKASIGGELEAIAFRKQVAVHAAIQAHMKGIQTEVARALNSFKIVVDTDKVMLSQLDGILTARGGLSHSQDFAKSMTLLKDMRELNKAVKDGWWVKTNDALREVFSNSILSGPATHLVNLVSNAAVLVNTSGERAIAAGFGKFRRTFGSQEEAVEFREAASLMYGATAGFMEAFHITARGRQAIAKASKQFALGDLKGAEATIEAVDPEELGSVYRAFSSGEAGIDSRLFGTAESVEPAITGARFGMDTGEWSKPSNWLGNVVDYLGAINRTGGNRLLVTSDELFKTMNYRGELHAQAYREASKKGLEGDALNREIAKLLADPTPEMRAVAMDAMRTNTFTNKLDGYSKKWSGMVNTPGSPFWLFTPFVRTPVNLFHYTMERNPATFWAYKQMRDDFKAGGIKRDMAVAKVTQGTILMGLGMYLASEGVLTGTAPAKNQAEVTAGKQSGSVKIGDSYYNINRIDPFAMALNWAADIKNMWDKVSNNEMEGLASMAVLSLSNNLLSKQYFSGVVDFVESIMSARRDRDGGLESTDPLGMWIDRMGNSFIPFAGMRRSLAAAEDPVRKETDSFVKYVKANTVGLSDSLADRRNIFGDPVPKGGPWWSPVRITELNKDPAYKELLRLDLDMKEPARSLPIGDGIASVQLTAEQYSRYLQLAGEPFKKWMTEMVTSPQWKSIPEGDGTVLGAKENILKAQYSRFLRVARVQVMNEFPDLKKKFNAGKAKAIQARTGTLPEWLLEEGQ